MATKEFQTLKAQALAEIMVPLPDNQIVKEAESSEILGKKVTSEKEAFSLYNEYAFRIGFSVRKTKTRYRENSRELRGREFACNKAGLKENKGKDGKMYTKLDTRTNCKAMVYFEIKDGVWTVARHRTEHNHRFCPSDQRHLLRSHRKIDRQQLLYLKKLINSGVKIADAIRVMKKEAGGSPSLGFTKRDAYDEILRQKKKHLDGCDANTLIKLFRKEEKKEPDFYYDFECDEEGSIERFFWRDSQMKKDYMLFGDLVVHDTTYRTNKYNLICGPFVGMNHHGQNVMFGCGFLLNENTESFIWLFDKFLDSMGGKMPITIMTD